MSDAGVQSKASSGLERASLPPWDVVAESLSQYRANERPGTLSAVITSKKGHCRRIEGRNVPGNAVARGRERNDEFVKTSESRIWAVEAIQVGAVPIHGRIVALTVIILNTYC